MLFTHKASRKKWQKITYVACVACHIDRIGKDCKNVVLSWSCANVWNIFANICPVFCTILNLQIKNMFEIDYNGIVFRKKNVWNVSFQNRGIFKLKLKHFSLILYMIFNVKYGRKKCDDRRLSRERFFVLRYWRLVVKADEALNHKIRIRRKQGNK